MNKKFSTLLAGMALLSVMSVNAQTTPSRVDPVSYTHLDVYKRQTQDGLVHLL